jgi:Flp pilus assembly protein TadB
MALGLILGALIVALLWEGNARRRAALAKIKALETEKQKAQAKIQEAREKRSQGYGELPAAIFLMVLGIALFILAIYLLGTGQTF